MERNKRMRHGDGVKDGLPPATDLSYAAGAALREAAKGKSSAWDVCPACLVLEGWVSFAAVNKDIMIDDSHTMAMYLV